jgi:hypothetical protein
VIVDRVGRANSDKGDDQLAHYEPGFVHSR